MGSSETVGGGTSPVGDSGLSEKSKAHLSTWPAEQGRDSYKLQRASEVTMHSLCSVESKSGGRGVVGGKQVRRSAELRKRDGGNLGWGQGRMGQWGGKGLESQ